MILPTPEFDPMFANDGIPFRTKMLAYIEQEFADIVNDRQRFLYSNSGMDWFTQQANSDVSELRPNEAA